MEGSAKTLSTNQEELKQVILVNGWLDMPAGKLASQVSHASMVFLTNWIKTGVVVTKNCREINQEISASFEEERQTLELDYRYIEEIVPWLTKSFPKIVLLARSQEELEDIIIRAEAFGLNENEGYFKIIDSGRTVFNGINTHTCTGFVPMPQNVINKLFGSLPLLK